MEYITESSLQYFGAWSGGEDTLETIKKLCRVKKDWKYIDELEEYIKEIFDTIPHETQINDFLWFERDEIAEIFGYDNWEMLTKEIPEKN